MMRHRKIRKVLAILLFVTVVIAGFGQAVLQLWNWLMPQIFGLPRIGFWQAIGLLALSWILFGGMRGMHSGRRQWRGRFRGRCRDDRDALYTNFAAEHLTADQREHFRQRLERRCGGWKPERA